MTFIAGTDRELNVSLMLLTTIEPDIFSRTKQALETRIKITHYKVLTPTQVFSPISNLPSAVFPQICQVIEYFAHKHGFRTAIIAPGPYVSGYTPGAVKYPNEILMYHTSVIWLCIMHGVP